MVQRWRERSHFGKGAGSLNTLNICSPSSINFYVVFTSEMWLQHFLAVDLKGVSPRERVDVLVQLRK